MRFLPFMTLHLSHTYYTDNRCPDFWIKPTVETQTLLKNHRCVLQTFANGICILMPVTEQNVQFIALPKGVIFAFQLHLHNPDFALFTDLTELTAVVAPLYTNVNLSPGKSGQLALVSRQVWSTEHFVVRHPAQEDRFILHGRPLTRLKPTDFKVEGNVKTKLLYDEITKTVTINSQMAKQGDTFSIHYPTIPPRASDVFADVEIQYTDPLPAIVDGPREFQITFNAKQAHWKYYLITNQTSDQFQIEDKATDPVGFSATNRRDLKQNPDSNDKMAIALAAQYPAAQRWRFVSDQPVVCQQEGRKSLQLKKSDDVVIEALPNPAVHQYALERSSDPEVVVGSLFHVFKYFT